MSKEVTRHCPNCKTEITVAFEGEPLGKGVIKECPDCKSPVLFCPDGYLLQAVTPFVSRRQDQPGYLVSERKSLVLSGHCEE